MALLLLVVLAVVGFFPLWLRQQQLEARSQALESRAAVPEPEAAAAPEIAPPEPPSPVESAAVPAEPPLPRASAAEQIGGWFERYVGGRLLRRLEEAGGRSGVRDFP